MNESHEYETDASGYGVGDLWAIMGPGDKGDCEDHVLTKMQALLDAGMDAKNMQIVIGKTESGQWHAYLAIQTSNRGTLILDNRYPNILNMNNIPYQHYSYQRAGQSWASFTTQLETVPIEYMACNAMAFADGDDVVIEFTSQDWNSPKVIGFKDNPAGCGVRLLDEWQSERFLWSAATQTNFTPSEGENRMVLVGIGCENNESSSVVTGVTLGGKALTEIEQDYISRYSGFSWWSNCAWLGYLAEADIAEMAGNNLIATWASQPDNSTLLAFATFENVDQVTPIEDSSIAKEEGNEPELTSGIFTTTGGQAVYFACTGLNYGAVDKEPWLWTPPEGWTAIWEYGHAFICGAGHRDSQQGAGVEAVLSNLTDANGVVIGAAIKEA